MLIDLSRFTKPKTIILPITNRVGKYGSRVIKFNVEDGWYSVELGNVPRLLRKATLLETYKETSNMTKVKLYAFGPDGIPCNFDNFTRDGFNESVKVYFLEQPLFTAINAIKWEDNKFYYAGIDFNFHKDILGQLRKALDSNSNITQIKGVTPELRYYFLLANLQKKTLESMEKLRLLKISQEEMKKRMAEFKSTLEFRIKDAVISAGGKFLSLQKRGKKFMVTWKVGGQEVKSIIKDDLRIDNAGFCLSNSDKEHSLHSLVNLAKLFQKEQPLYITRQ